MVCAIGGLQKSGKFTCSGHTFQGCHFCILFTRPKSCFGGLNEQSGYLVFRSFPLHILAIGSTVAVHACVAPILQQFRSSFPLFGWRQAIVFCSLKLITVLDC